MMQIGPEGDEVETTRTEARRIAFVSDTHTRAPDGSDLPTALLDALRGSGLIVHLGHVGSPGCLDRLAKVAPTPACRTALDDRTFAILDLRRGYVESEIVDLARPPPTAL